MAERHQMDSAPPKGLWQRLRALFAPKPVEEPEEEDFRTSAARGQSKPSTGGAKGAHAPSRAELAASLKEEAKPEKPPEKQAKSDSPAAKREHVDGNIPVKGSKLYELYCLKNGFEPPANAAGSFSPTMMMASGKTPTGEERAILKAMEQAIRALPQYNVKKPHHSSEDELPEPVQPVDAQAFVRITGDGMAAYLFIAPPLHGGEPLSPEQIRRSLAENSINTGLDEEMIESLCYPGNNLILTQIAQGTPPVPGEDGEITDYYNRQVGIQLTVQDDNTIDFRDLGWLQTVREGEIICDVLMPTPGLEGRTVQGKPVAPQPGKPAVPPMGEGTHLSEDGRSLLASMDGVLTFTHDAFRVDPLLIVQGDVDSGVGHLEVIGDILVCGDICTGFCVSASGNITVKGMVEGATVKAGGSIQVAMGMNGGGQGSMVAEGCIMCRFIENADVHADGNIVCESIVHSNVHSNRFISVLSGAGTIVGGALHAKEYIEAVNVGNDTHRMAAITLGSPTTILEQMQQVEEKRNALAREIEQKEKDILYLSSEKETLSYRDSVRLDDLRQGVKIQKMQLANLGRRLGILGRMHQDYSKCYLLAQTVYPPLQLTIGGMDANLRDVLENVKVCRTADAIVLEDRRSLVGQKQVLTV